jgi:ankyrin repeat protein
MSWDYYIDCDSCVCEGVSQACTEGKIDALKAMLAVHPSWVHRRSEQGESCLHVAGILGQQEVTSLVLNAGGDPNIRSTFALGLRMHPLSWNVYHGHVGNVRRLLQGGANVNLDVDHMSNKGTAVTVLDIVEEIMQNTAQQDPRMDQYRQLYQLLLEHGAMRYIDFLQRQNTEKEL